uniref:dienelactone hydrolase family protein n=1 Tax=Halomonas sp. TaxID=1486246 RepID=UPI0026331819|nr:dienelactone hydrolase family protein [Halomonas sp.]
MTYDEITLQTRDGECPAYVFTPEGQGPWHAVIVYMDAFGIRPGLKQMAETIASNGYLVLLPDLFYRLGNYGPLVPKEIFAGDDFRAVIGPLMASTDNHMAAADTEACLKYLDAREDVIGGKIATVGFCMGGGMAITVAASYPERVAAAVSFHGGNLATDQPTSPHLQAPKIQAELYIAVADNDKSYPPAMAERFEKALSDAGVRYRSELYRGAAHGWMKPDFPIYDKVAADKGWAEMFELFERTLR